ncbi:MAG: TonB family protein [Rhizomicrobium sp.]|jgi:TonB family protein
MRGLLLAIAALIGFGSPAFAETPAADSRPVLDLDGKGSNCASSFYPAAAIREGEQGATTIDIHVDDAGKPSGVDIVRSSGFADLDQASKDCVMKGWHFRPAARNGKPVAGIKEVMIVWKLAPTSKSPELQGSMEEACANIYSDAPNRWPSYRSTTVQFRISATGAVMRPFVASSSGDALFDIKAEQCAARLKYSVPVIDDVPTELSWSSAVRWSPHTGLAYTDGYDLGPYCADALFPATLWNGDPRGATIISFHIVQHGAIAAAVIERSSGNPGLDQAALQCVKSWKMPFADLLGPSFDAGAVVRINWKDGHAFVLNDAWK